jgi:hypothetical protein
MLVRLLALVGAVVIISLLIKLGIMLIPFMFLEHNLLSKYRGVFALVTGGTDGIGLVISRKLIAQGFNAHIIGFKSGRITQSELPDGYQLSENDLSDPLFVSRLCDWSSLNQPALIVQGVR